MWKVLTILTVINLNVCLSNKTETDESKSGRIVNGIDAEENHWRFMAAIGYNDANIFIFLCGGIVLDSCNILTAAHCVMSFDATGFDRSHLSVHTSSYKVPTTNLNRHYKVRKVIVHESFDLKTMVNDVAIFHLEKPLPVNSSSESEVVCVTRIRKEDIIDTNKCVVMGWGQTKSFHFSSVLQELFLPVLPDDYCAQHTTSYDNNAMFCAGYRNGVRDACNGDSGGPLLCATDYGDGVHYKFVLYGIVSYGEGCAQPNNPGYYTKLSGFSDWIDSNLRKA